MTQQTNFWTDAIAPTSLGTGVANTTLNGGVSYSVSSKAGSLIEITPEVVSTGAHTAAEALMIRSGANSVDLPTITPKDYVFSGALGGLGTFAFAMYPTLRAMPYNTPLKYSTSNVNFTGECQIANTVAPEMLVDLTFSSGGPLGPEQYYTAPANETNTGTAAGFVAGNDITINGGRVLNMISCVLTNGVVTASEDIHGRGQMSSVNFIGVPSPLVYVSQPIAAALGTAVAVAIPGDRIKKINVPIAPSFVGNTAFNLDEALTATGNFINWVGYLK